MGLRGVRLFCVASGLILVFPCKAVVGEYEWDLVAENTMIAGHELGIGSCWIGVEMRGGENEESQKEARVLEHYF
ncbi:hypothetical protein MCP_2211 [Methanocella paludicola SANAE]|uniref:Uncharacterized protein n=1 Tax=Methanocella paludicola (strain DSM 17711 / JCM 13418 / NBRC 101707 / SANAE) TaxID=304371 RepID=D1Z0R1_METPS|nr:hypothetical protein [Methanocella paludicola]BAI62283.1 hypothetical protein MCP_2211 [Methanocella paludicola SANAE]